MRDAVLWLKKNSDRRLPWLIVGKGPTFSRHSEINLLNYHTLTLNHVIKHVPARLAHFTDIDALADCGSVIREPSSACVVVIPWVPHVNNQPGRYDLRSWCSQLPLLEFLAQNDRLVSYNSTISRRRNKRLPLIRVRYFSAVAAVNILAEAGVKEIHTLGVDGGKIYSPEFAKQTLLSNGRTSFDIQFQEIESSIKKYGLAYKPLFVRPGE